MAHNGMEKVKQANSVVIPPILWVLCNSFVMQFYIEDKKVKLNQKGEVTEVADDAVMYGDRQTALLEAQRSLAFMIEFWNLRYGCSSVLCVPSNILPRSSPDDAEKLCLPVVHTMWPKVFFFFVLMNFNSRF